MPEQFQIRPAEPDDTPAVARVLVDTWRSTFRGLLSDEFLDGMSYERQEQRHRFYIAQDRVAYFVAVDRSSGEVIGFISGGPNRHAEYQRCAAEIYAFYILSGHQRRGIGKQLLDALNLRMAESGFPSMMVWVLANNPNRGFYERVGGQQIATRPITLGPDTVEEAAYAWDDLATVSSGPTPASAGFARLPSVMRRPGTRPKGA